MSTGPKSGWGGRRPGSGRKSALSAADIQVKAMLKTAKKMAKQTGKTLDEILVAIAYGAFEAKVKERLLAIKIFKEFAMGTTGDPDGKIGANRLPVIGLPAMQTDPAKVIYPKEGTA